MYWETWLVEGAGHAVIEKKAELGPDVLSSVERLIYCLWVADYGMRNAGDLQTAADLYPTFQTEAATLSNTLGLSTTSEAFHLPTADLERAYFEHFDAICAEVSEALGSPTQSI